jgi:hypothetical protein
MLHSKTHRNWSALVAALDMGSRSDEVAGEQRVILVPDPGGTSRCRWRGAIIRVSWHCRGVRSSRRAHRECLHAKRACELYIVI